MRIAISNLAWDPDEDSSVAELLVASEIDAIDIAPGKYFPDPYKATENEIKNIKYWWLDHGVEITGMQAILFGTSGLNIFGDSESRRKMLNHLDAICRIGEGLGATRLVFGSPKNRNREGLSDAQSKEIAINFFESLGDIASNHGVVICLEPNPVQYSANFMINSEETASIVLAVNHDSIGMQLDAGAITMNKEKPDLVLSKYYDLIRHIHISEPNLKPIGDCNTDHEKIYNAISRCLPNHVVSIEMLATKDESHLKSIERALLFTIDQYRGSCQVGGLR